jgi:hypothetical protein
LGFDPPLIWQEPLGTLAAFWLAYLQAVGELGEMKKIMNERTDE